MNGGVAEGRIAAGLTGGQRQPLHVPVEPDRQGSSGFKRCVVGLPVGRAIAWRLRSAHVNRLHNQGLAWQLVQQSHADRSYKVDFFLKSISGNNYFVEFKTDSSSRRDKQDWYLKEASNRGMREIVGGVVRIASVSSYKKKYDHLLSKLEHLDLINENREYIGTSSGIDIIYIQPNNNNQRDDVIITFDWISNWLTGKYGNNEFATNFSSALSSWSND